MTLATLIGPPESEIPSGHAIESGSLVHSGAASAELVAWEDHVEQQVSEVMRARLIRCKRGYTETEAPARLQQQFTLCYSTEEPPGASASNSAQPSAQSIESSYTDTYSVTNGTRDQNIVRRHAAVEV